MSAIGRRCLSFVIYAVVCSVAIPTLAATTTTVNGEIVETYCWAVHEVGGVGHAQCGIECAKRGLPVALYDSRSHGAYILLPARDRASLPSDLVAAMGQRVKIQGEVIARGGIRFLVVQSWQRIATAR